MFLASKMFPCNEAKMKLIHSTYIIMFLFMFDVSMANASNRIKESKEINDLGYSAQIPESWISPISDSHTRLKNQGYTASCFDVFIRRHDNKISISYIRISKYVGESPKGPWRLKFKEGCSRPGVTYEYSLGGDFIKTIFTRH